MPQTDPYLYTTSTISNLYRTHDLGYQQRLDTPPELCLDQFPHEWAIPKTVSWRQAIVWCNQHLGPVDGSWTWLTTRSLRFKDEHVIHQLNLTF